MNKSLLTRRFFIGGAASFGAFGGCRFFGNHNYKEDGTPNLRFGVVSDIHIDHCAGPGMSPHYDNSIFQHTLEWFRSQDVDAVMIAGDMADNGMVEQLQAVAAAWYAVFPNDRYPDGRPIEKVFVYGNHDQHGYLYGNHAEKKYPDVNERWKHVLLADFGGWWKRIFHEDYAPFYAKDIKGYRFLGAHWDDGSGVHSKAHGWTFGVELKDYLNKQGKTLDPALPFFYVQHPHPKDTCYGPWAWGHDNGRVTRALSAYPNAVAFSGHSHYALTDERSLWQGAFSSVGTSSLRYTGTPYNERLPAGYENTDTEGKNALRINAAKLSGRLSSCGDCQQGMLWSVYDDCIVVRRREFQCNLDVGDAWVMPLPVAESKPFAFAERAKKFAAPAFAAGVKLAVSRTTAKTRGGKSRKGSEKIPATEKACFKVTAPAVVLDKNARAFSYEFVAEGKDGTKKTKYMMVEGFNHPLSYPKLKNAVSCCFALDDLPRGAVRFVVTPLNCFQSRGKPLVSDWQQNA